MKHRIEGNIIDIEHREIFEGSIEFEDGIITDIKKHPTSNNEYLLSGFIDAHVHIESSMLTPRMFGQWILPHGTVAIVTDPHEIANVLGIKGIQFMIKNSRTSPVKTFFTIPSCVPATPFDASGGILSANDTEQMAASGEFVGLSEMMNVPGVLHKDPEVMAKLEIARKYHLPIDGHAPTLTQEKLKEYIDNGINTDHECSTLEEAKKKINLGMKILIREGSAAHNYEALKSLIRTHPNEVMFCTDDSHPDDIMGVGHINKLVKRSIRDGFNLFDILKIASLNPIHHYNLDVGTLKTGDKADFIAIDNLDNFNVTKVYIDGIKQYDKKEPGQSNNKTLAITENINNFNHKKIEKSELKKEIQDKNTVISLVKNELLTEVYTYIPKIRMSNLESDLTQDILKIVYLNRYHNGLPQVAFCKGFQLKKGAFASSVAHDSHNIIAVGCSDEELTKAINSLIEHKGGLAVCCDNTTEILSLPVGGIMSNQDGEYVVSHYTKLNNKIQSMGCNIHSPFMTLSFLSLVVIPQIKIGEKGLFLYDSFQWIEDKE